MFKALNSGSKTRVLATISGSQSATKRETKSEGGIIMMGDATKEKNADFGKVATIVHVSDPSDELKPGMKVIIGERSGRSAIRDGDKVLYVLNRDEIWAYETDEE